MRTRRTKNWKYFWETEEARYTWHILSDLPSLICFVQRWKNVIYVNFSLKNLAPCHIVYGSICMVRGYLRKVETPQLRWYFILSDQYFALFLLFYFQYTTFLWTACSKIVIQSFKSTLKAFYLTGMCFASHYNYIGYNYMYTLFPPFIFYFSWIKKLY